MYGNKIKIKQGTSYIKEWDKICRQGDKNPRVVGKDQRFKAVLSFSACRNISSAKCLYARKFKPPISFILLRKNTFYQIVKI